MVTSQLNRGGKGTSPFYLRQEIVMTSRSWEYEKAIGEFPDCNKCNEKLVYNLFYGYFYCPVCKQKYI